MNVSRVMCARFLTPGGNCSDRVDPTTRVFRDPEEMDGVSNMLFVDLCVHCRDRGLVPTVWHTPLSYEVDDYNEDTDEYDERIVVNIGGFEAPTESYLKVRVEEAIHSRSTVT